MIISCVEKEKTQEYKYQLKLLYSSPKYLKNGHGRKIKDGDFVILNLKYFYLLKTIMFLNFFLFKNYINQLNDIKNIN